MLKAGQPVFFGCDVGQFSDRVGGVMDTALHQYANAFNVTFGLTKANRLELGESSMTHAMVISGVHLDASGMPLRYKVENSWGKDVGEKGYFVMSDAWFDEFVYQVVVPKALAPKELVKVYEKGEKVVLPPWDPMVSTCVLCSPYAINETYRVLWHNLTFTHARSFISVGMYVHHHWFFIK